ncbi:MAG TPA: SulP family inorganic anion transporter [Treponemataceae bacterium]|jgi:SulP family sulfate permease|nr:SulP family inorganic anion transporter [Treponemataceae bacterium]HQF72653.1 SulP family inorganic anion transporter [Treponemataceae bacterium]
MNKHYEPQLVSVLREGYTLKQFVSDLSAGILVGIVAIPLAIAFAIASDVNPAQGITTAVVAGLAISIFSGSRFQIGGPTGAFIIIISGIVAQHGYSGLAIATFMAGLLLILMGMLKLGVIIQYIPYPVTVGFTTGIAVIIASGQIRDGLGLAMDTVPQEFVHKITAYAGHISSINPWAVLIFALSICIILLWPKINRKVPGSFIAIIVCTLAVRLLNLPVETIEARYGTISGAIRLAPIPHLSLDLLRTLFFPALTIAFLAGIESLLSAVVADGMKGTKHRSNMELVAQGIANCLSPLFGGIPATGAIARTATNIKNGGSTPVAGIIHALTIFLILLFFGKWASLIPLSTIAAVLMVVAYNMSELRLFTRMFKNPKSDVAVMLATFLLTVFLDLTVAIGIGVLLAVFLFMRRVSEATTMQYLSRYSSDESTAEDGVQEILSSIPDDIQVFEVNGPFFFGVADRFKDTIASLDKKPRVMILRMRKVLSIDATAIRAIESIYTRTQRDGTRLILSGVHTQPLLALIKCGFMDEIGKENICGTLEEALQAAQNT